MVGATGGFSTSPQSRSDRSLQVRVLRDARAAVGGVLAAGQRRLHLDGRLVQMGADRREPSYGGGRGRRPARRGRPARRAGRGDRGRWSRPSCEGDSMRSTTSATSPPSKATVCSPVLSAPMLDPLGNDPCGLGLRRSRRWLLRRAEPSPRTASKHAAGGARTCAMVDPLRRPGSHGMPPRTMMALRRERSGSWSPSAVR